MKKQTMNVAAILAALGRMGLEELPSERGRRSSKHRSNANAVRLRRRRRKLARLQAQRTRRQG